MENYKTWAIVIACKIIIIIIILVCHRRCRKRYAYNNGVRVLEPVVLPPGFTNYPRQEVSQSSNNQVITSMPSSNCYPPTVYAPYSSNGAVMYPPEYRPNSTNITANVSHPADGTPSTVQTYDSTNDLPPSYENAIKQKGLR